MLSRPGRSHRRVALDRLRESLELIDDRLDGLVDAALDGVRVGAGGDVLQALLKMASARTVAVVVPSPATSEVLLATSLTSWRPCSRTLLASSSISLATVTPSLVTVGPPKTCR
jgi:hypothetical protein